LYALILGFFLAKEKKKSNETNARKKKKEEKKNKHNKRLQDSHVCDDACCSLVQYNEQTSVAKTRTKRRKQADRQNTHT
jgi:hypothetical protein